MFKAKLDKVKAREEKRENKENRRKLAAAAAAAANAASQANDGGTTAASAGSRKSDSQKRSRPRQRPSRDSFDDLAAAIAPGGRVAILKYFGIFVFSYCTKLIQMT